MELSLGLSARSPLEETLLVSACNGGDAYLGTDQERHRGGYETYTSTRYAMLAEGSRPLPYALGAGGRYVDGILSLIKGLTETQSPAPS